jgi:hypothetical protein
MAIPATYNLTDDRAIYAGDTYEFNVVLYSSVEDPDNPGSYIAGDPLDLTGCVVLAQIRPANRGAADMPPTPFDVINADTLGTDGTINLVMPPSNTLALVTNVPKLVGVWDLQVTYASDEDDEPIVRTYLAGSVSIIKDVSYSA